MRSHKLAVFGLILTLLFTTQVTLFAQEDSIKLTQDFMLISEAGTTIFSYPEDWVAEQMVEPNLVFISNNQGLLDDITRGLDFGEFLADMATVPIANLNTDLPADAPLSDYLNVYLGSNFADTTIIESTLGSNEVAIAELTNDRNDVRRYTLRFDDVLIYLDMRTVVGEITPFIDTMDALVASIDFTTEILSTVDTIDDNTTSDDDLILSETLTIDDDSTGTFSVNYPSGWFASDDISNLVISNVEAGLDFELDDENILEIGEIAVGFIPLTMDSVNSTLTDVDIDTAFDFLTEFLALISDEQLGNPYFDTGPVESVEINDLLDVAQSTGRLIDDDGNSQNSQFIAIVSDQGVVLILVIAGEDTITIYQDTIYDMVRSIEYRAP